MDERAQVLRGVALVVVATLLFSVTDVLTKHLTTAHAIGLVIAVRYMVNLVVLVVVLGPRHRAGLWRTQRTGLVVVRGLCLAAASLTMGLALRLMPVAETVAIIYLAPFLMMGFAVLLLGEKVAMAGWIGAAVAFAGVLLIARPGGGLDPLGVTLAIANAFFAAGYQLLSRVLARTETTAALSFHTMALGSMVFGLLALPSLGGPMPPIGDFGLMALLGVTAAAAHFLFTGAFRMAPASVLAPVNYLHLVWAACLGWAVFDTVPSGTSMIGMALVAGAGVAVALRARFAALP